MLKNVFPVNNYLLTESEVFMGKSYSETLLYWIRPGQGLRFSREDRMFEVSKLFITCIWVKRQRNFILT